MSEPPPTCSCKKRAPPSGPSGGAFTVYNIPVKVMDEDAKLFNTQTLSELHQFSLQSVLSFKRVQRARVKVSDLVVMNLEESKAVVYLNRERGVRQLEVKFLDMGDDFQEACVSGRVVFCVKPEIAPGVIICKPRILAAEISAFVKHFMELFDVERTHMFGDPTLIMEPMPITRTSQHFLEKLVSLNLEKNNNPYDENNPYHRERAQNTLDAILEFQNASWLSVCVEVKDLEVRKIDVVSESRVSTLWSRLNMVHPGVIHLFHKTSLPPAKLNMLVKHWTHGGYSYLELFTNTNRQNHDLKIIAQGLKIKPWDPNTRPRYFRIQRPISGEDVYDCEKGMDITRGDGRIATLLVLQDKFVFVIWRENPLLQQNLQLKN